jgi:hypothetical protein
MKNKFPTLAVIVLIFAIAWFASELYKINVNIPWLPLILIIVAIGWIFNRFRE